jgi:hypothetical protein
MLSVSALNIEDETFKTMFMLTDLEKKFVLNTIAKLKKMTRKGCSEYTNIFISSALID